MATALTNNDPYPVAPAKIFDTMKSREYWDAKYGELALEHKIDTFEEQGGQWVVTTTREVPANLPAFAKKFVGERTIITQTEKWSPDGSGGYKVDWVCVIKNAPGTFTGWMHIVPARTGEADWKLEFTVNAKVPMVGKKLEGVVIAETKENLLKEYDFNKRWMTSH